MGRLPSAVAGALQERLRLPRGDNVRGGAAVAAGAAEDAQPVPQLPGRHRGGGPRPNAVGVAGGGLPWLAGWPGGSGDR